MNNVLRMLIERYQRPLLFLARGLGSLTRPSYCLGIELFVGTLGTFCLDGIVEVGRLGTHYSKERQLTGMNNGQTDCDLECGRNMTRG